VLTSPHLVYKDLCQSPKVGWRPQRCKQGHGTVCSGPGSSG